MPGHGIEKVRHFPARVSLMKPLLPNAKKFGVAGGVKPRNALIVIRWTTLPKKSPPPVPLPQDDSLGNRINYLRRCLGEPRTTFATRCGHPVSLIAKYERNEIKKPNTKILLDFAKALNVSPDKILSIQHFEPISNETEFSCLENLLPIAEFGPRLRTLRLRANIGLKALASKLGINRESIRRYENNMTKPTKERLSQIIAILKTSSTELQNKYYHRIPECSRELERSE
jgi:transcriptional regulator with XRE-family HTH domain